MTCKILLGCLLGASLLFGCAKKEPTMHPSKHKNQFKEPTITRYDTRDVLK